MNNSTASSRTYSTVDVCGVRFLAVKEHECVEYIFDELGAGRGGWVVTPNLSILRRCVREPSEHNLVSLATTVVPDGMPILWAARLQGTPLPARVPGSDLVTSVSAAAAEKGRSIFLLGGAPGTAEGAEAELLRRHPELRIVGRNCPPFGFEHDPALMDEIGDEVAAAKPDLIYVALSFPKSELLIARIRARCSQSWWLGVGVSFSFLAGEIHRAPLWMQRAGLEWCHRMAQEPRRLFRRYLIEGLPFGVELLGRSVVRRLRHDSDWFLQSFEREYRNQ